MQFLTATLTVITALHVTPAVEGMKVDIASHLQHLSTHRYPNKVYKDARERVAEYISDRFEDYGLTVEQQKLSAFASPDPSNASFCSTDEDVCPVNTKGLNVIGISGSEWKEGGSVIVLGAGYDTDGLTNPLYDNGAGVAVLLETARIYQAMDIIPRLTTLFVAFDLSVERYGGMASGGGGGGLPGAWSLVQVYLRTFVDQNTSRVGGAIVLGPLMNVNHEADSQRFDLEKLFPAAHQDIEAGGYKGDFLAMVTQGTEGDERGRTLAGQVAHSYREVGGRLVELSLGNQSHTLLPPSLPPRQAAYFWGATYKMRPSPLPAILLTDTESSRAWPPHTAPRIHPTESQQVFLTTTVNSLVHFLMDRQAVEDWVELWLLATLMASCAVNLLLMILCLHTLYTSNPTDKTQTEPQCTSETLQLKDIQHTANDVILAQCVPQHTGNGVTSPQCVPQHTGNGVTSPQCVPQHTGNGVTSPQCVPQHTGNGVTSPQCVPQHTGNGVTSPQSVLH